MQITRCAGRRCCTTADTFQSACHPRQLRHGCLGSAEGASSPADQRWETPDKHIRLAGGEPESGVGSGGGSSSPGRSSSLQDRAVSVVRGDWAVSLRRQMPVCSWSRRAATSRPPPALPYRALPLVPCRRLLSVRFSLQFYSQRCHYWSDRRQQVYRDAQWSADCSGARSAAALSWQLSGVEAVSEAVQWWCEAESNLWPPSACWNVSLGVVACSGFITGNWPHEINAASSVHRLNKQTSNNAYHKHFITHKSSVCNTVHGVCNSEWVFHVHLYEPCFSEV